ncbi:MAG: RNA chaperone Hfq [Clostridiales bacterium]|nr:RNA chaperone Hfq [Clostridiales bacterium]
MYHNHSFRRSANHILNDQSTDQNFDYSAHSRDAFRSFKNANLQEIFLNNCRKNGNIVSVYLVAGERRRGVIIGFDNQSIILSDNNTQNLIYKSSITSVIPEENVQYIFGENLKKDFCDSKVAVH